MLCVFKAHTKWWCCDKGGSVRILSEFLDVRKWLVQQIIISYTYVG